MAAELGDLACTHKVFILSRVNNTIKLQSILESLEISKDVSTRANLLIDFLKIRLLGEDVSFILSSKLDERRTEVLKLSRRTEALKRLDVLLNSCRRIG